MASKSNKDVDVVKMAESLNEELIKLVKKVSGWKLNKKHQQGKPKTKNVC